MISLRGRALRLIYSISWFVRTIVYPTLDHSASFVCLPEPPILFACVCPYRKGECQITSRGPIVTATLFLATSMWPLSLR